MSIATEITRLQTAKANIKASIEAKGVTVPAADTLDDYAGYIDQISGGIDPEELQEPLYFKFVQNGSIGIQKVGSPTQKTFYYSYDKINWTAYTPSSSPTMINPGIDKIMYWKADGNYCSTDTSNYYNITFPNTRVYVGGNIMSLLGDNWATNTTIPTNYCFYWLFYNNEYMLSTPVLPATTLTEFCYNEMFRACKYITVAPVLPATTLQPQCYRGMFSTCSKLVVAPELPATTLVDYCYRDMFYNCVSLIIAPELPATTLARACYWGMFSGCSGLITAPVLPATKTVANCYGYLFMNCTSLICIKSYATDLSSGGLSGWLLSASSSGTFICPSGMENVYTRNIDGIPSGWTIQTMSA